MEIGIELPGVKLGVLEADDLQVVPVDVAFAKLMDEVCDRKRREFTLESLAEAQETRLVRAMFREWDMDPSKYRPSSESLLRRVVQGNGLYRVSNAVDICNLGHLAVTTAHRSPRLSYFATAPPTRPTRESERKCGTWKAGLCSLTLMVHSAAPSAIPRAA